jgi:hypothetical protein
VIYFNGIVDVIGPFDSQEDAESYAESHNMGHFDWSVHEVVEKND